MTSHRRIKRETMPYSTKDKKHVSHGKEKSDGKASEKTPLPLSQKSVYIDVKNGKQVEVIEGQLKRLGAIIEKFLSREVNYVISSSAPPRSEERQSNGDNPQSPSFANVPSPFSSIPSPTASSDSKTPPVVSRGKALAQIAYARSRASTVVANAEKWGIKVVSLETASKWLEKETKKIEKEKEQDNMKKENDVQKPKKKLAKARRKVFKGCYIKFEAINKMYRPIKSELERWPKLNLLAPPGLSSFSEVKINIKQFQRRHSSYRNGKASLSTSSGKGNLRKACSMSSGKESISAWTTLQATPEVVAVPINTTGDVKRHLDHQKKRPDKSQGYCECCRLKYKNMNEHIKEEEHQSFARDKSNYEGLDTLMKQVPSTIQFLQDVLLRHCAQKQTESSDSQEVATDFDADSPPMLSPIPREATPPREATGNMPSIECSPVGGKFTPNEVDKTPDDSRPQAVVIRRPTPSGIFVSPRRRVPTPSKKPWMQERSMVFRDSPMASLQLSDVCSNINFMVSESLLANPFNNSNGTFINPNCDQSKKKSIVRSLVHMSDFVSSSENISDEERLSRVVKEREHTVSKSPESSSENNEDAKLKSCEQKNLTKVVLNQADADSITEGHQMAKFRENSLERPQDNTGKSSKVIRSPDFFVPCIADRVKRRTRVSNIGVAQKDNIDFENACNHESSPQEFDNAVVSVDEGRVSMTLKEEENCTVESENITDCNWGENDIVGVDEVCKETKEVEERNLSQKALVGGKVDIICTEFHCEKILESVNDGNSVIKDSKDKPHLISRTRRNSERRRNESRSQKTLASDYVDTQPVENLPISKAGHTDNEMIGDICLLPEKATSCLIVKESGTEKEQGTSGLKRVRGNKTNENLECLLNKSQDAHESFNAKNHSMKDLSRGRQGYKRRRSNSSVVPSKKEDDFTDIPVVENKRSSSEGRKIDNGCRSENSSLEKEPAINIADSRKSRVRPGTLSCHEKVYADDGEGMDFSNIHDVALTKGDQEPQLISLDQIKSSNLANDCKVESLMDEGNDKRENLMHAGKRIFRGKKFHSTNANWDVKSEDREQVTQNISDCVKDRRSCTLFNHEGQYANDGEGVNSKSGENIEEVSKANPQVYQKKKSLQPAVVIRRLTSCRTSLVKRNKSWSKSMSKKDWSQSEGDTNSSMYQKEELENQCLGGEDLNQNDLTSPIKQDTPAVVGQQQKVSIGSTLLLDTKKTVESKKCVGKTLQKSEYQSGRVEKGRSKKHRRHRDKSNLLITQHDTLCKDSIVAAKGSELSKHSDSPRRIRMKFKKFDDDCYSSTLEEDFDVGFKNVPLGTTPDRMKTKFSSPPYRSENEMGSPNSKCKFQSSDSIDLLETPVKSNCVSKHPSVKNLKLCPFQSTPQKEDCKNLKTEIVGNVKSERLQSSNLSLKKKRKLSGACATDTKDVLENKIELCTTESEFSQQIELRENSQNRDDIQQFDPKPMKRRKREKDHVLTNFKHLSPIKGKGFESNLSVLHSDSSPPHRKKENEKKHDMEDGSNEKHKNTSRKSMSKDKSKKRKSKRKLSLSDESGSVARKKVKLNSNSSPTVTQGNDSDGSVDESLACAKVDCSPRENEKCTTVSCMEYKNSQNKDKQMTKADEVSYNRLHSEASGNIADLLNFVPNFSSPGKTDSSWDDACNSYLSTSLKHNNETPGQKGSLTPHFGRSVLWSPFKHNSSAKKNSPRSKESGKKNCPSSSASILDNPPCLLTPTKRGKSSQNLETSPFVQKVDSVISFNHMSPQRLHFSPIKVNNPAQHRDRSPMVQEIDSVVSFNHMSPQRLHFSPIKVNSSAQHRDRSPMVQEIDSVISFNHMSPQRLQFSPRKSEQQSEIPGRSSVRKHL